MSTKVRKGNKGDASVLRPTMMCAVPLIMDRIYKNIIDSVEKRGPTFKKIFEYCFNYKLYWVKHGMTTPLLDKLIFSKISKLLGNLDSKMFPCFSSLFFSILIHFLTIRFFLNKFGLSELITFYPLFFFSIWTYFYQLLSILNLCLCILMPHPSA